MSVRTLEGYVRQSTCQVADMRRPLVPASHIIQARNDLFIGKDEAYVMNRKKDKSVLRKEGHVYLLDLFVKVPAGAAAPIKHKPMEVDAINQVADGREQKEASDFLTAANQLLMAGGVSVEDGSKRTETVRPQHEEHFESQLVCDSAFNAKSVGDDIELNGETDDGDGGRGDWI